MSPGCSIPVANPSASIITQTQHFLDAYRFYMLNGAFFVHPSESWISLVWHTCTSPLTPLRGSAIEHERRDAFIPLLGASQQIIHIEHEFFAKGGGAEIFGAFKLAFSSSLCCVHRGVLIRYQMCIRHVFSSSLIAKIQGVDIQCNVSLWT